MNNRNRDHLQRLLQRGRDLNAEREATTWTTREGKHLQISEMAITHILNTIALLERNAERALQLLGLPHDEEKHVVLAAAALFPQYPNLVQAFRDKCEALASSDSPAATNHYQTARFALLELD